MIITNFLFDRIEDYVQLIHAAIINESSVK